jgi:hypothetical protein
MYCHRRNHSVWHWSKRALQGVRMYLILTIELNTMTFCTKWSSLESTLYVSIVKRDNVFHVNSSDRYIYTYCCCHLSLERRIKEKVYKCQWMFTKCRNQFLILSTTRNDVCLIACCVKQTSIICYSFFSLCLVKNERQRQ